MAQILNGTYEVLSLIGKGGMSTVFKARHVRLNTIVAVKSVRKDQAVDLAAEVHILTKLNHPNLVRVIDIFEDEKLLYIVMDYVEGEDLQHVIKREKVIPEETVTEWFRTLAGLLRYLHTRKPPIIYRDMKPANVILQTDGTLKLIDFGIAREYKAQASGDTTYIGTNGFAAPEQFGLAQSDGRTDIYSLGMTMFYLATGKSPLEPPYGYTPARKLNPEISEKLEAILEKCIKSNPEDRYQNADELLNDLYDGETMPFPTGTQAFKTEPVQPTPWASVPAPDTTVIGPESRPAVPGKRTPVGLYAGIGAAALALVAGIVIMVSGRGKPAPADIPDEPVSEAAVQAAEEEPVQAAEEPAPQPEGKEPSAPEEPVHTQQEPDSETQDPADQEEKGGSGSTAERPEGTVRIGTSCSYAPYSFTGPDGTCTGMEPMLAERILDVPYEIVVMSFDELMPSLEAGQIDVIMDAMPETEERKQQFDFTDPYYREGITVILQNGMDIGDDVNRLSGIRAASTPDDPMLEAFMTKFNMNHIADIETGEHVQESYGMLGGEVQAYVVRESSLLNNSQILTYPIMYLRGADLYDKYGMVFRDDPDLRFMVRKGDDRMRLYLNACIAEMPEYAAEDYLNTAKETYLGILGHW